MDPQPDLLRRRDARATAAVAVQFAVNGAFFASFVPRLPELRDELGIGTSAIGILLTGASASGLLASLTVARLIGRFGTRRVLFGGGVAIAISLVLVGVANSWPLALAGLLGMFAFDVLVDVSMNMQGSWLSARRERPIMNRLHGLWSLGSAAGGLVASTLAGASVSLTAHLVAAAGVLVLASSIVATQLLPVDEVHATPAEAPGTVVAARHFSKARFYVAGLTAVAIEMAAMSWAAFRITDDLHGSASVAALAYVAVAGGQMVARFAGDHLAHRWGSDVLMRGSAVLAMLGIVAAAVIGVEALVVVAFLFAGFGLAALAPRLYDLAARAGGTGSSMGVLTAGIRTATIVVPASVAAVASATSVGLALVLAALVSGVGFLVSTRR